MKELIECPCNNCKDGKFDAEHKYQYDCKYEYVSRHIYRDINQFIDREAFSYNCKYFKAKL